MKSFVILSLMLFLVSCKEDNQERLVIDIARQAQTIDNFAASDCWSIQHIGKWPDAKREQIARWLFSTEMDENGNPEGIGLSAWRYNIGTGSREVGEKSGIEWPWRINECPVSDNGVFDAAKQTGERWFMRKAKEYGINRFVGFVTTPPIYMTINGRTTNKGRKEISYNLASEYYTAFGDFLADVVEGIKKYDGVDLNIISPVNEPEWEWDNTLGEGTPALDSEVSAVVRVIDSVFTARNITSDLLINESGQIDYLFSDATMRPDRDNHIYNYYDPSSHLYIGDIARLKNRICAHSYWSEYPLDRLVESRKTLRTHLDKYGLDYWQTEFCPMTQNDEDIYGWGKDLSMKLALYVARIIHADITIANATAWQWWLAVTNEDYKDGLIYVEPDETHNDGTYTDSKLMWTLGNFSRFVRPGSIRLVPVSGFDEPFGLMTTAYLNSKENQLIIAAINYSDESRSTSLKLKNGKVKSAKAYITSDNKRDNLRYMPELVAGNMLCIPARSVVTYVMELK